MLTPGEISVGMIVTVLDSKPIEREVSDMLGAVTTVTNIDRSGMGEAQRVIAVKLPYVLTVRLSQGIFRNMKCTYDTRRMTFMELGQEWLDAMELKKPVDI